MNRRTHRPFVFAKRAVTDEGGLEACVEDVEQLGEIRVEVMCYKVD